MNREKIFIALTFLLAFAVYVSAQTLKVKPIKLTIQDKKEIIRQVFDDSFEKLLKSSNFDQCLTPIIDDKKVVFILSKINMNLLSDNFNEYRLMVMSRSRINEEVKKNNGECYFTLGEFQTIGSKIKVILSRTSDEIYRFRNSSEYTRWISGGGYVYEFEKANKWRMASSNKVIISS